MKPVLALTLAAFFVTFPLLAEREEVTSEIFHLGTKGLPEWNEFRSSEPHGRNLSVTFEAKANQEESTLFIRQDDVKQGWRVSLNGKRLGNLERFESKMLHTLKVPAKTLKEGENRLSIAAPTALDDVFVGGAFLVNKAREDALRQSFLEVRVTDSKGAPLPCRITITNEKDYLMPLQVEASPLVAVRTGVVYSLEGKTTAGVLPGKYLVYASRGFEYGVATAKVRVAEGETRSIRLSLDREVPTEGWISCDPHVHVKTFSGHGDSTVEERIPTIAGEGLELPISTDHNHHADYGPYQEAAGASAFFTTVIGNEVTTKVGHFNAFPIKKGAPLPNHETESWKELFKSIRATPGVEVILLNHPRNVHSNFSPTDPSHFNRASGESQREGGLEMDAIEVITSAALQADYTGPFEDWFALLNAGKRVTAAGSSDTHDVNRYLLGQGRTYLQCPDKDPANVDLAAACRAFREGRALVSMGLLTHLRVEERFEVGDLATKLPSKATARIQVLGPRWVDATRVVLYGNGLPIWESEVESAPNAITKADLKVELPKFTHDIHLVAIANGPGVTKPFWEIPRPYQHKSKEYVSRVIGATNPIWLDFDGDGKYTSPRGYAERLVEKKPMLAETLAKLSDFDSSVAVQVAALLTVRGVDLKETKAEAAWEKASPAIRTGFSEFLEASP